MFIAIGDHNPVYRAGLQKFLGDLDSHVSFAEFSSYDSLHEFVASKGGEIDLVVFDLSLQGANRLVGLREICALLDGIPVIVVGEDDGRQRAVNAIQSGAHAYLSKRASGEAVFQAARKALEGEITIDYRPRVPTTQKPACSKDRNWEYLLTTKEGKNLTNRQAQILQKLASGHTNKAIAEHLGISIYTVRLHVSAIFRALDVSNRTQAALIARELLR